MADDLGGLPAGIELRAARESDRDFLLSLYRTTRDEELKLVSWTDAEKAAFVEMQFTAQDAAYRATYPGASFLVALVDRVPAGRLYLVRLPHELRVIDITLSVGHRGHGIGTSLLEWVMARAKRDGVDVTLHVEPWNPAKRLYERLGFATVEARGIYEFMRMRADGQLKTAS